MVVVDEWLVPPSVTDHEVPVGSPDSVNVTEYVFAGGGVLDEWNPTVKMFG